MKKENEETWLERHCDQICDGLLVVGGVIMGVGIGCYIGYGIRSTEVSDQLKETIPELVDRCGEISYQQTYKTLKKVSPELVKAIYQKGGDYEISKAVTEGFYDHELVKSILEKCGK